MHVSGVTEWLPAVSVVSNLITSASDNSLCVTWEGYKFNISLDCKEASRRVHSTIKIVLSWYFLENTTSLIPR